MKTSKRNLLGSARDQFIQAGRKRVAIRVQSEAGSGGASVVKLTPEMLAEGNRTMFRLPIVQSLLEALNKRRIPEVRNEVAMRP